MHELDFNSLSGFAAKRLPGSYEGDIDGDEGENDE